jgi:hypothetical protein
VRRDMFEVIIERPRWCGGRAKKKRREERTARAFERAPSKSGMRRFSRTKDLNENLAPLRRFLLRHVGKPWSKVHSEMRAVLSMSSAVQKHVMDHVKQFVEENPLMIDGRPHRPQAFGGKYFPLRSHPKWPDFYVCPKTGLLRVPAHTPRKRAKAGDRESTMDARRGMGQ